MDARPSGRARLTTAGGRHGIEVRKRPDAGARVVYRLGVTLDPAACYPALRARDARFDGLFFVGVTSTGIYCRPVCPARLPAAAGCEFFEHAAQAERAGFRACLRCRPELAPGHGSVDAVSRLVRLAAVRIGAGYLNERSVEALAASLGVTVPPPAPRDGGGARRVAGRARADAGASRSRSSWSRTPRCRWPASRPPRASRASGGSTPRSGRGWGAPPRRSGATPASRSAPGDAGEAIALRLDYRPPYAWDELLRYLAGRAIPGVERVVDGEYRRTVVLGRRVGWLAVAPWEGRPALRARVAPSLAPCLMEVAARLKAVFDLDARPDLVAAHLERDATVGPLVRARPGLRVPGTFDGFELAVRAVLGQQVSVAAATTLSGRLAARLGTPLESGLVGVDRAFPSPERLARATLADVRAVGLPATRAQTVIDLAQAVATGRVDLALGEAPEPVVRALQEIRGIGPWTAGYVALRALRWPDAFLGGDLGVRKALGVGTTKAAEARAEGMRPWRAYAVLHLWHSLA